LVGVEKTRTTTPAPYFVRTESPGAIFISFPSLSPPDVGDGGGVGASLYSLERWLGTMSEMGDEDNGAGTTSQKSTYYYVPSVLYRSAKCEASEYVSRKKSYFLLLIAQFPRPTSHTSNTVDKLNKSKLSGLVNVFILVLPLVLWWWCCCCLFLRQ
jgi:hypothetical protein